MIQASITVVNVLATTVTVATAAVTADVVTIADVTGIVLAAGIVVAAAIVATAATDAIAAAAASGDTSGTAAAFTACRPGAGLLTTRDRRMGIYFGDGRGVRQRATMTRDLGMGCRL